jgi:hypothetical protein
MYYTISQAVFRAKRRKSFEACRPFSFPLNLKRFAPRAFAPQRFVAPLLRMTVIPGLEEKSELHRLTKKTVRSKGDSIKTED